MTDELAPWLASLLAGAVAAAIVLALRRPQAAIPTGTTARSPDAPRRARLPLGGISIFLGVVVSAIAFVPLEDAYRGILIGTAVIAILGIVADVRGLPPVVMFLGQIGAAGIAVAYGVSIERFNFPFVGVVAELPAWADVPLTIAWIVVLVRLVDLVDGLDGLAAAVCGAASLTFVFLSLSLGTRGSAILSAIVAGACAGFLFRNFYPSRILLGHSGTLVLGYLVATVAIEGLLKTAALVGVLLPFLALAIVALDTSVAVANRIFARIDPRSRPQRSGRRLVVVLDLVVRRRRDERSRARRLRLPRGRRVAPLEDAGGGRGRDRRARGLDLRHRADRVHEAGPARRASRAPDRPPAHAGRLLAGGGDPGGARLVPQHAAEHGDRHPAAGRRDRRRRARPAFPAPRRRRRVSCSSPRDDPSCTRATVSGARATSSRCGSSAR